MIINADLHIHSPYTKKTHEEINFNLLATNAEKKGLHLLSTGDCLHPQWIKHINQLEPVDEGTFRTAAIQMVLIFRFK